MPHPRALFECRYQERRAVVCADTESNFLVLLFRKRTHVDSFSTRDFLFAIGHAYSALMEDCDLEALTRHAEQSAPIEGVTTAVETLSPGMVRLDFLSGAARLFTRYTKRKHEAQMLADSYRNALRGWQLATRAPKPKGIVPLLVRTERRHRVALVRILPNEGDATLALRIFEEDRLIFTRFRDVAAALEQANALIPAGYGGSLIVADSDEPERYGPIVAFPERRAKQKVQTPDVTLTGYTYQQAGTRTTVAQETGEHPGFSVLVYVADRFVVRVTGDRDRGGYGYTLPLAIQKAQDLLRNLRGWQRPEDDT